jgi:hypothetical protein
MGSRDLVSSKVAIGSPSSRGLHSTTITLILDGVYYVSLSFVVVNSTGSRRIFLKIYIHRLNVYANNESEQTCTCN